MTNFYSLRNFVIAKHYCLCRGKHIAKTYFLAQHVNKTHILTCILKLLNSNVVPRSKILTKNVLKQILTNCIAKI